MKPKKHLGQHFLTAPSYCRRIAAAIPATADDHVLEIGPGRGALSIHLLERFPRFMCVEKDTDMVPFLLEKLGEGEYRIQTGDALDFDFGLAGFPLHVAGNLPYSAGAYIIKKTLCYGAAIRSCTFMVQKEVAQRIVAAPHSKTFGFLSVMCQYFGAAKILFSVPPGAFFPRPSVDSAVFQILPDPARLGRIEKKEWPRFFAFVTGGFSMRRKRLAKVLALKPGAGLFDEIFEKLEIPVDARAEDVSPDQWVALYRESCNE